MSNHMKVLANQHPILWNWCDSRIWISILASHSSMAAALSAYDHSVPPANQKKNKFLSSLFFRMWLSINLWLYCMYGKLCQILQIVCDNIWREPILVANPGRLFIDSDIGFSLIFEIKSCTKTVQGSLQYLLCHFIPSNSKILFVNESILERDDFLWNLGSSGRLFKTKSEKKRNLEW